MCDTPANGYVTWVTLFQASNLAPFAWQYAIGKWTKAQADADCALTCVDPTVEELAYETPLLAKYRPVATVAGSADQPVYAPNGDGTRNTTALVGITAQHGGACVETQRIPGTNYFGIPAASLTVTQTSSAPVVVPMWVYAVCSVSFPIPPSPMPGSPSAPGGSILARMGGLMPQFLK